MPEPSLRGDLRGFLFLSPGAPDLDGSGGQLMAAQVPRLPWAPAASAWSPATAGRVQGLELRIRNLGNLEALQRDLVQKG